MGVQYFVTLSNFTKDSVLRIGIFREDDVFKIRFFPSPWVRALLGTSTGYFLRGILDAMGVGVPPQ